MKTCDGLEKYIENKCERSGSAQIPPGNGMHVHTYHQVIRLMCVNPTNMNYQRMHDDKKCK